MRFCGEGKVYFQEPERAGVSLAHYIKDHAMHAFLTLHSPTDPQRLIRTRRLDGFTSPTFIQPPAEVHPAPQHEGLRAAIRPGAAPGDERGLGAAAGCVAPSGTTGSPPPAPRPPHPAPRTPQRAPIPTPGPSCVARGLHGWRPRANPNPQPRWGASFFTWRASPSGAPGL